MNSEIRLTEPEPSPPLRPRTVSTQVWFESLLNQVNKDTFEALERLLPKTPQGFLHTISSVASHATSRPIDGDTRAFQALSVPLWEILGRKKKGWRSYVLRVSCEAVGGPFARLLDWLALPEIVHVGSLIIDDIQDSSEIRRGGKACHLLHGIGPAINAGTFAYVVVQTLIEKSSFRDPKKLTLYQECVSLLREAHIGQGLDIEGLNLDCMDCDANPDQAIEAILDIHRRKSGIAFGAFARMGAILGDGSAAQVRVLGDFFEEVGTLFQVRDDIINITGSPDNLKEHGEDLQRGKITLPVAVALKHLPEQTRLGLTQRLASSSQPPDSLKGDLLEAIIATNSIQLCERLIEERFQAAWNVLRNSDCTLAEMENIMRFSRRVLDAHY